MALGALVSVRGGEVGVSGLAGAQPISVHIASRQIVFALNKGPSLRIGM